MKPKYLINLFTGKIFLNSIEHLDPVTDEWTTFVTVPEKSISRSKNMPLNVDLAETTIEIKGKDTERNIMLEARMNKGTNDKDIEESSLFEMDEEANTMNPSGNGVIHEKHNEATSDERIIQGKYGSNDPITANDKIDAVSRHVLRYC